MSEAKPRNVHTQPGSVEFGRTGMYFLSSHSALCGHCGMFGAPCCPCRPSLLLLCFPVSSKMASLPTKHFTDPHWPLLSNKYRAEKSVVRASTFLNQKTVNKWPLRGHWHGHGHGHGANMARGDPPGTGCQPLQGQGPSEVTHCVTVFTGKWG